MTEEESGLLGLKLSLCLKSCFNGNTGTEGVKQSTAFFSKEILFFWMKLKSNPKSLFLCKGEGRKCKMRSPSPRVYQSRS